MNCPYCGTELNDGAKFCANCGKPLAAPVPVAEPIVSEPIQTVKESTQPSVQQPAPVEQPVQAPTEPIGEAAERGVQEHVPEAAPAVGTDPRNLLTAAQYFWLTVLFSIPVVGLVFLFVWGCGKPKNLSLKRYSMAMLTMRLLGCFLYLACTVFLLLVSNGMIPGLTVDLSLSGLPFIG